MTGSNKNNEKGHYDCLLQGQEDDLFERISAYVDAELADDEMEQLRQHILLCNPCAETEKKFRNVDFQLHKDMSRPLVSRSLKINGDAGSKTPARYLKSKSFQSVPPRRWLVTSSIAAAGIVALAAFATGAFRLDNDHGNSGVGGLENSFSQVFMTDVVAPLGEMALNNDVCKSQQKQVARSLDLELRLLRLDTKNISTNDDEVRKINEEIESLMIQVKQLGNATDESANDVLSL